jgi:hypothetical protein
MRIFPHFQPRPKTREKLSCSVCGKRPAEWRPRIFGWNYVHGEVLCDECDSHLTLHAPDAAKAANGSESDSTPPGDAGR